MARQIAQPNSTSSTLARSSIYSRSHRNTFFQCYSNMPLWIDNKKRQKAVHYEVWSVSGGKKKQWECVLHAKSVEKAGKNRRESELTKVVHTFSFHFYYLFALYTRKGSSSRLRTLWMRWHPFFPLFPFFSFPSLFFLSFLSQHFN